MINNINYIVTTQMLSIIALFSLISILQSLEVFFLFPPFMCVFCLFINNEKLEKVCLHLKSRIILNYSF